MIGHFDDYTQLISRFQGINILVLGDVMLDKFVWGHVSRISPEAPVPVVKMSKESSMPGGAANVAANIATLSGNALLYGIVGKDSSADELLRDLNQRGINTGGLIAVDDRPTTVKERIVAHSQQVVRIDREETHEIAKQTSQEILKQIQEQISEKVDAIIIEDYGKGLISAEMLKSVISMAGEHGVPVAVDPKDKHFSYYQGVTILTPNHHEAGQAVGIKIVDEQTLCQAGQKILEMLSCQSVLITRGEDGMTLFEQGQSPVHIPTVAQEVYDVSGAGDTVIASLSLALGAKASLKQAAYLSNLAAGFVVGKIGVTTINQEELKDTLCKFSQ